MKDRLITPYLFGLLIASLIALVASIRLLPGLFYGIWFQSEPITHTIWASCALIALFFAIKPPKCIEHPYIRLWIWGLIAALSMSFFHIMPHLSLLGMPQIGNGILTLACFVVLMVAFLKLLPIKHVALLLTLMSNLVSYGLVLITLSNQYGLIHLPLYPYQDYLAFYSFFNGMITHLFLKQKNANIKLLFINLFLGSAIIIYSQNLTAIICLLGILPACYILFERLKWLPSWLKPFLIIVMPISLTALIHITGYFQLDSSIGSRHLLNLVIAKAMIHQPSALLTGFGFGHYSELLTQYYINEHVQFFDSKGQWSPSWDAHSFTHFHSHNFLVEWLLSLGVPGVIFILYSFYALYRYTPKPYQPLCFLFIIGLTSLLSGWFQMPGSIPLMALAFAFFLANDEKEDDLIPAPRNYLYAGLLVLFSISTTYLLVNEVNLTTNTQHRLTMPNTAFACPYQTQDDKRGNYHISIALSQDLVHIKQNEDQQALACYLDQLKVLEKGTNIKLQQLIFTSELALSPLGRIRPDITKDVLKNWPDQLERFLQSTPHRTDIAAAHYFYLLQTQQEKKLQQVTRAWLKQYPGDPVALWFFGVTLLRHTPDGLLFMRRALDLGIEAYIPIAENEKKVVYQYYPK